MALDKFSQHAVPRLKGQELEAAIQEFAKQHTVVRVKGRSSCSIMNLRGVLVLISYGCISEDLGLKSTITQLGAAAQAVTDSVGVSAS